MQHDVEELTFIALLVDPSTLVAVGVLGAANDSLPCLLVQDMRQVLEKLNLLHRKFELGDIFSGALPGRLCQRTELSLYVERQVLEAWDLGRVLWSVLHPRLLSCLINIINDRFGTNVGILEMQV